MGATLIAAPCDIKVRAQRDALLSRLLCHFTLANSWDLPYRGDRFFRGRLKRHVPPSRRPKIFRIGCCLFDGDIR